MNPIPFAIDTLPECLEQEPNNTPSDAQRVTLPIIVNGRIDKEDDWDVYQFTGKAGQTVEALDLKVLEGSTVELQLELNRPAAQMRLALLDGDLAKVLAILQQGLASDEQPILLSEPADNADGRLDRGWFAYLTAYSYEKNTNASGQKRLNISTADAGTMSQRLSLPMWAAESIVKAREKKKFEHLVDLLDVQRDTSVSVDSSAGGPSAGDEDQQPVTHLPERDRQERQRRPGDHCP